MLTFKPLENIDRRYLGALRFRDNATTGVIRRPLRVQADGLRVRTNRSNLHVITWAAGLESHLGEFLEAPEPPAPPVDPFTLTVIDPLGEYLPRIVRLRLPRAPDPGADESVFTPIDVTLYQAPAAKPAPNWSIIRASIRRQSEAAADRVPIAGALVRVVDENDALIRSGLTDERGEALVGLPGIKVTDFTRDEAEPPAERGGPGGRGPRADPPGLGEGEEADANNDDLVTGPVLAFKTSVSLQVIVHEEMPWPVDPDELEENREDWQRAAEPEDRTALELEPRQTQSVELLVTMPGNA